MEPGLKRMLQAAGVAAGTAGLLGGAGAALDARITIRSVGNIEETSLYLKEVDAWATIGSNETPGDSRNYVVVGYGNPNQIGDDTSIEAGYNEVDGFYGGVYKTGP